MNKIILIICCLASISTISAQTVQGTIKPGSSPNAVMIALRANGVITGQITNLQFVIQVPNTVSPLPTVSIRSNPLGSATPSLNYVPTANYLTAITEEAGFRNYLFAVTTLGSPSFTFSNGVEVNALELQFDGGPASPTNQVRLAQLPNGGSNFQMNFYIEISGADRTNETNMFYGSGFNNSSSGYAGYSFIPLNNVALPIRLIDFQVVRQNFDAQIKWTVSEDQDNERFEVERSFDGVNFAKIADVPKQPGTGSKTYELTDANLRSYNKAVIHYRIKDIDYNGRSSYTKIIPIRLDLKGTIALYPNPAKDGFYVAIPYQNPDQSRVQLQLINKAGQVLETKQITKTMATNYYYNLNPAYASGDYTLRIFEEQNLVDTKKIVVVR